MTDIDPALIKQAARKVAEFYHFSNADIARAVLDAVAPAIRAQALRDAADWLDEFRPFPGEETEALRERADQIEEGK